MRTFVERFLVRLRPNQLLAIRVAASLILATPLAVHADVGFRVGVEGTVGYYDTYVTTRGVYWFPERQPIGFAFMLSYWLPGSMLSVDLETAVETFLVSYSASGTSPGTGVVVRPGIRFNIPGVPLYLRGAIPINTGKVMMGHLKHIAAVDAEIFDLRTGLGVLLPLEMLNPFLEANMDFPLGGGRGPSLFSAWAFSIIAGMDARLPF